MNNNVVCPNCNYANPIGAKFCSKCGGSLELNQVTKLVQEYATTGHLVIERKKSFWGCAISLKIEIAGNSYDLSNGSKLEFDLVPGVYSISYKVWCRRLKTVDVNMTSAGNARIYFVPDLLFGGFKVSKESKLQ